MSRDEYIEAIYALLPRLKCRGKCFMSCGPIFMSDAEEERLDETGDRPLPTHHPGLGAATCNKLTKDKRCSIYDKRPLICRLYGMVEGMKCQHGCMPSGGHMSDAKARELLNEMETIPCQNQTKESNNTLSASSLAVIGALSRYLESNTENQSKAGKPES